MILWQGSGCFQGPRSATRELLIPWPVEYSPFFWGPPTRLTRFFQSSDKEYLAEIQLGQTTDTLDGEGEVLQKTLYLKFPLSKQTRC